MNTTGLQYGGVTGLTALQVLRRVQDDTGIRLRIERSETKEESLSRLVAQETCVKLVFVVKEFRRTRQGRTLVREGLRAVVLTKVMETWSILMDSVQMTDADEPVEEVYRGRIETPDEVAERVAYEEMCHRPGSSRYPMMNADRLRQLREGGL